MKYITSFKKSIYQLGFKIIGQSSEKAVLIIVVAFGRFPPIFFSLNEMASYLAPNISCPFLLSNLFVVLWEATFSHRQTF